MKTSFKDIEVGQLFHTGKSKANYPYKGKDGFAVAELEKTSKSESVCINQFGYGNTRMIGRKQKQFANTVCFLIN